MRSALPTFNEVWQRQFRSSFLKQIAKFGDEQTYLVGCSGGMDSMLLLVLMSQLLPNKIRVININHQLQKASDDWAQFVEKFCLENNIPIILETVVVHDGNLEEQARRARYSAFQKHLLATDILVLAHHQQDQAETVILRLLSGSGIHGLSAMKSVDVRSDQIIWRPFLDLSRENIEEWVTQLSIPYVNDPTNLDTHYDRAWCRQDLWKILQSRYPKMQQAVSRTSYLMQDAEQILHEVLIQDLSLCGDENQLKLERLLSLSDARRRQLISFWMKGAGQYRPSFDMVERLMNEVVFAKPDATAALHWSGHYYVRYQEVIYRLEKQVYLAQQNLEMESPSQLTFDLHNLVQLASGQYKIETAQVGLSFDLLGQHLSIETRNGGEKIHLHGRVGTWPLKKAIQEAQIFPWLRHTIQILSLDNVMLGVFTPKGFWLAQSDYCEVGGWQPKLVSLE